MGQEAVAEEMWNQGELIEDGCLGAGGESPAEDGEGIIGLSQRRHWRWDPGRDWLWLGKEDTYVMAG